MVATPLSENSPLQDIKFPRGGSSGVENGLNNLGWVYELDPLRGQAHSFYCSGLGWNIEPPAWAPEEARPDEILYLGSILCPAAMGQWEVVEPGPGKLSPGLPGAERSGEMHTDWTDCSEVRDKAVPISNSADRSICEPQNCNPGEREPERPHC